MKFKYQFLADIYQLAMNKERSNDPHLRLNTFERLLRNYICNTSLDAAFMLEAGKVLKMINVAQDHVIEEQVGCDIDGDGIVGRTPETDDCLGLVLSQKYGIN